MILRSGSRGLLAGGNAIEYMFLDDYSDVDAQPIADPRTPNAGYVTLTNAAQMSTDGTDLIGHEASAGTAGAAYSKNDGAATTIANGQLFAVKKTSASGSSSLGAGFHNSTSQPVSYIGFASIVTNFGVTLRNGSDFYNFASAIFGAGSTVAYLFDNDLCHIYTYNITDLEPRWELRIIIPAISGDYYFSVQTCINQASGTNKIGHSAAAENLVGIVGGTSCGTSEGATADAPSADFVAKMVLTTLPSAGSFIYKVRIQDANNYLDVEVNSSGDVIVNEIVAGVRTPQVSMLGKAADGESLVISADGDDIDVWSKADRIRYTTSNFNTEVGCEVGSLGTGGVVSDILLHKFAPTGAIVNKLNTVGGV